MSLSPVNWSITARRKWDPALAPIENGNVDFRYIGDVSIAIMTDGHAESLKLDQVLDMQRWSKDATTPDWTFNPSLFTSGAISTAPL